jgi:murein L,D-transpeptidase YcbB/YkuD
VIALCVLAIVVELAPPLIERALVDELADRLRARIETAHAEPAAMAVNGRRLYVPADVARFYDKRLYRPAWIDADDRVARARELLGSILEADRHGLQPSDYHLATLAGLLGKLGGAGERLEHRDVDVLVDLELTATDAFQIYAAHLLAGRVDPVRLRPNLRPTPPDADLLARSLEQAITSGRVRDSLVELLPVAHAYRELEAALAHYRELSRRGDWPVVPAAGKLEIGDQGTPVQMLRRRLAAGGDLAVDATASPWFDAELETAVRAFQSRHGLELDGVVGPATAAALQVTASDRAIQIAGNLERWRWIARDLGSRHVLVNVPAFELRVVEDENTVMTMRAVVGRPYRRTPLFSATMTYLVVSPYWQVPPGIAVRDILPAIKKDPAYLAERGIRVFQGWGAKEREIDPGTVEWDHLSASAFPYRFRQEPGDKNMLGRIKFMFPNLHNVYLHDTPLRELFQPARRDFSSGCIRIERPFELADYLLRGDPRWTRDAVAAAAAVDAETTIPLPAPIPVHIVYWTAWVEDGVVQFRDDIYGRDAPLAAALGLSPH